MSPDKLAIPSNACILKQQGSKAMRDICYRGHKGKARATRRHIQNFTACGLRVFTNDYCGGAMHRVSRAFSVFRRP
jgi:hypothetical protein